METRKNESQDIVIFNVRVSKAQIIRLRIYFTISAVAGVILFFVKHY